MSEMRPRVAVWPVVLSGGAGTRLWPLSRTQHPKQLLQLTDGGTMLQGTVQRVLQSERFQPPVVVTSEDNRFLVRDQLREIGVNAATIILEPAQRNTAPAIALAAHHIGETDPDGVMLIMPADHVIGDVEAFYTALSALSEPVIRGRLGTLGVQPDRPEIGFGYIRKGKKCTSQAYVAANFTEKPDAQTASAFLSSGEYLWNAGIFLFRVHDILKALSSYVPDVAVAAEAAMAQATQDDCFLRPDTGSFLKAPSISIDHAVMEQADNVVVVPVEMEWSDVGSWAAVWELGKKDYEGNVTSGDVLTIDSQNNLVRSVDGHTLVTLGLKDMVVVTTRDATLIAPRDRAQGVKAAVEELVARGGKIHEMHTTVHRPWGTYEVTGSGERFQTKRIVVNSGEKLSLQMHHHRSEHWIVVSGTAKVTVGDQELLLQENESTYIPAGVVHRLENPGKIPLHLIEVQCGSYLGEDDIVRLDDIYSRTPSTS
jgi:mannose-1-phosphate guanylyltransferase/mannose-6-phosphate isomerase